MDIPEGVDTRTFECNGLTAEIPQPYNEGHTCDAHEAHALNQIMVENVRNNLRKKVQSAVKENENFSSADFQQMVDDYISDYNIGAGGGGGPRLDPVERCAIDMAEGLVKSKLKKQGQRLTEVGSKRIRELALDLIERNPVITERAKKQVELQAGLEAELE